jgi:hypothetical protein
VQGSCRDTGGTLPGRVHMHLARQETQVCGIARRGHSLPRETIFK